MEIKEFKIRCSAIGQIMTNSRVKSEPLSQTAKTYCENWLKGQIFNREKHFETKYTSKGNEVEDNSLDFVAKMLDLGMLVKNEEYFQNEFMHGTPDSIPKDFVIDVKNSWDWSTFPLLETDIPNHAYYLQLQGYMHLTGKKHAKLIYTLMDTPEHMIISEIKKYCFYNGFDSMDIDVNNKFYNEMTYSDIPDKYKIKVFDIEYDEKIIQEIQKKVYECRIYIDSLIKILK